MARTHELKTWPSFFEAIRIGHKRFEVRLNDRDYAVGDTLVLQEYDPGEMSGFRYTGRECRCVVTYVMPGRRFGLDPHWCVMGIEPAAPPASAPEVEHG